MKTEIIIVEPKSKLIPRSQSDLENLEEGSIVRVTHKKPYRNWDIYEGIFDGEAAFMLQSSTNPGEINSFRVRLDKIEFDSIYGAVLPEAGVTMTTYSPEDSWYQDKKGLFIKAGDWRNTDE